LSSGSACHASSSPRLSRFFGSSSAARRRRQHAVDGVEQTVRAGLAVADDVRVGEAEAAPVGGDRQARADGRAGELRFLDVGDLHAREATRHDVQQQQLAQLLLVLRLQQRRERALRQRGERRFGRREHRQRPLGLQLPRQTGGVEHRRLPLQLAAEAALRRQRPARDAQPRERQDAHRLDAGAVRPLPRQGAPAGRGATWTSDTCIDPWLPEDGAATVGLAWIIARDAALRVRRRAAAPPKA
jgi:hypothetical protein